jgi:hypothetical protein
MSRATETDHAVPHHAAAPESAPDLDAEHDPEPSRRASLAGLRREAAVQPAGKPSGATAKQQEAQHDKAEDKHRDGVEATLYLSAARIHEHAQIAMTLIKSRPPTGQEWPQVDAMIERYGEVMREVKRVEDGLSLLLPHHRRELAGAVLHFAGAVSSFALWWDKVQGYAIELGGFERVEHMTAHQLQQRVDRDIYKLCDIDPSTFVDRRPDGHKPGDLRKQAMKPVVEAALQCARSIRTGAVTGKAEVLMEDLKQLIWQLREIEVMLEETPVRQRSAAAPPGKLDETLQAAVEIRGLISSRPELGPLAQELSFRITSLKRSAGGRGSHP